MINATPASQSNHNRTSLKAWVRALEATAPITARPNHILPDVIQDLSNVFGRSPALVSDAECLTYDSLASRMNQYARWTIASGVTKSGVVALLMPNRPEYMAIWLGVTRAGGITALLNTNIEAQALAHCIDIVAPAHFIVASELLARFKTAEPYLKSAPRVWTHGDAAASDAQRIDLAIAQYSGEALAPEERRAITINDRALYVYTSGTTGLPKAANVSHHRLLVWSHWFAGMLETTAADRMYNCLPMYHSVGGIVATGAVLVHGGTVIVREKFSVSSFWDDVRRFDCTLVQYIGELCRYLFNSPPHTLERAHRIRAFCGNGLSADIWERFKDRFAIPQILEFYAATEGNFSLFNIEGKPGALGRVPRFLAHRFAATLVKFDLETGVPVRDGDGRCITCAPNEVGEAISKIADDDLYGGHFEGYSDQAASEQKILRNVFCAGDAWYRTGDLMRRDAQGFWYFVDRIGDTFRWKSENVSTREVAEAISAFPGIKEVAVYGVAVPKTEGRAGMALLVTDGKIDLDRLRLHIARRLPPYASPLFIRLSKSVEITPTFKQKKFELAREGFDPEQSQDAIYFNDPREKRYVPLDRKVFERILRGEAGL
jgi:fatty-acyl-CoA synthase